jgi:diacylglycerol kinase family enzyme
MRAHAGPRGAPLPTLGVLKLGTGNAIAKLLGASPPTVDGLRRDLFRATRAVPASLRLMEVDGRITPFAGTGLDTQILSDYHLVTGLLERLGLASTLGAGGCYAVSVAFRSTPLAFLRRLPEIEVVNLGSPAIRVGAGGVPIGDPIPRGEVLYRGPFKIVAGSAIPYYGLGMKLFPYAQQAAGRFQLRCASSSPIETLWNLPAIWRGEFASPTVHDFLVDKAEVRVARPVPFQVGGDLLPELRDRLLMATASRPIAVVN